MIDCFDCGDSMIGDPRLCCDSCWSARYQRDGNAAIGVVKAEIRERWPDFQLDTSRPVEPEIPVEVPIVGDEPMQGELL